MKELTRNILKWARRDPRIAILLVANLGLLLLIGLVILIAVLPAQTRPVPALNLSSSPATPTAISTLSGISLATATLRLEPTATPLPPTVNVTQLISLPNQGRNNAPTPPPDLTTRPGNTLTTTTPLATRR